MNYCDLFLDYHVAMIQDWIDRGRGLFVRVEIPHSGSGGESHLLTSVEQLHELISSQKNNEIEIFIFREPINNDDELDEKLEVHWVYGHPDEVLYLSVNKNRGHYESYQQEPDRYQQAISRWRKLSN